MRRNLVERQVTDEQADMLIAAMRCAFEEAEVDAAEIERLEPAMTYDPNDRHVLAAAVAAGSELAEESARLEAPGMPGPVHQRRPVVVVAANAPSGCRIRAISAIVGSGSIQ
jgi:acyl-CoA thioesterase